MKHLIIYAHPSQDSLNCHFKNTLVDYLQSKNQQIEIRDLYHINFNPVLSLQDIQGQRRGEIAQDIKFEQEFIIWADCITFIYPIWWTGLPAIVKGYIDRVFSYGFAYRYDQGIQKGLLTGKQVVIINSHGKSHQEYGSLGMDKALSLTSDKGIYSYCGLEIKDHLFFDKADKATPESVESWTEQIRNTFEVNFSN